ncbi:BNR repeat-containing protein [Daejeonella sp.]|uniref:BNR repeat-containing protein n=1 Tax=Daejeonella sp. TaxID=2805397 RepID=UPI0030C09745
MSLYSQNKHENPKLIRVADAWAKNSVNTVIFRRNSLITHKNQQYIAYYDQDKNLVVGKRNLGSSEWNLNTTSYKGDATDAHKSISIIVDGDGYLHVAWNQHGNALHYCKSIKPGSLEMSEKMSMTGFKEKSVTYPEFYLEPDGDLIFLYRDGSSGNGSLMLNHYECKTKKWTQVQDGWISGEGNRNPYWQAFIDNKGTIHISWVWRETPDVATNHDMAYARSKDGGKTWQKSSGENYILPVTFAKAEYAVKIPQNSELINSTSMTADNDGNPYIVSYWRSADNPVPQYHIIFKTGARWVVQQVSNRTIPFSLRGGGTKRIPISRPQIVVRQKGTEKQLLIIFRDEERGSKVSVAMSPDISAGKWSLKDLTAFSVNMWEPSYDTELWRKKKKLHIFLQNVDQGDAETIREIQAQPVSVLEWKPVWK